MLNPELNADIAIRQLDRERKQYIAQSQAFRALEERRTRSVVKPPLMSPLGRLWRAITAPRRQPAMGRAEAAA